MNISYQHRWVCFKDGTSYVGKAKKIYRRLKDHVNQGDWKWSDIMKIIADEVKGGPKALSAAERAKLLKETGGLHPSDASNVRNVNLPGGQ